MLCLPFILEVASHLICVFVCECVYVSMYVCEGYMFMLMREHTFVCGIVSVHICDTVYR